METALVDVHVCVEPLIVQDNAVSEIEKAEPTRSVKASETVPPGPELAVNIILEVVQSTGIKAIFDGRSLVFFTALIG